MGMSAGGGGGKNPTPQVNVTPLVDVALVVLIIFMVVTPLMTKTFWLNLPPKPEESQPKPPKKDKDPPVVMTVDPDGTIRINKKPIDRARLPTELPRMLASQDKPVLFFDAKDATDYGTAVEVMDLARASGARSIAILTKNVSD